MIRQNEISPPEQADSPLQTKISLFLIVTISVVIGLGMAYISYQIGYARLTVFVLAFLLLLSLLYQFSMVIRRGQWMQPYTFFVIVYGGYVISGFYLSSGATGSLDVLIDAHTFPYIALALIYAILGGWAFFLGYRGWKIGLLKQQLSIPYYPKLFNKWIFRIIFMLFLTIGILGYIQFIRTSGGLSFLFQNIIYRTRLRSSGYLSLFLFQMVVAVWVWMTYDRRFFRKISAWVVSIGITIGMFSLGNRTPIIQYWIVFYLFGIYNGKSLRKTSSSLENSIESGTVKFSNRISKKIRAVLGLALIAIAVFVLIFAFAAWRDASVYKISVKEGLSSYIDWEKAADTLFASGHLATLEIFSRVIEAIPESLSFQYGKTFIEFFTTPIPRSIWPNKPVSLGLQLKQILVNPDAVGGNPPSIVGELYLNFHIWGVLFGMYLIGAICYRVFLRTLKKSSNPSNVLFYFVFLGYFLMPWIRTNFSVAAVTFTYLSIPYLVSTKIINKYCVR